MAKIAVLASGSGSNFQAIADKLPAAGHSVCCLVYDRKDAYARIRAERAEIPAHYVCYAGKKREHAEREIAEIIGTYEPEYIVLAGFMRMLTPWFVTEFSGKIINIHPALLPRHPGTHGIEDSYNSGDSELGITIHYVDEGMDTGPVIHQASFTRNGNETLEQVAERIHQLEHENYPREIIRLLDKAAGDME